MTLPGRLVAWVRREPARTVNLLLAVITLAAAFGLHLTDGQTAALSALALLIAGGGEAVRAQVRPTITDTPADPLARRHMYPARLLRRTRRGRAVPTS